MKISKVSLCVASWGYLPECPLNGITIGDQEPWKDRGSDLLSNQRAEKVYTEALSFRRGIEKGENIVYFQLPADEIVGPIRLDPGKVPGCYIIHSLEFRAIVDDRKFPGNIAENQWNMDYTSWNRLTVQVLPLFFVTVIPEMWHQLSLDRINGPALVRFWMGKPSSFWYFGNEEIANKPSNIGLGQGLAG